MCEGLGAVRISDEPAPCAVVVGSHGVAHALHNDHLLAWLRAGKVALLYAAIACDAAAWLAVVLGSRCRFCGGIDLIYQLAHLNLFLLPHLAASLPGSTVLRGGGG